MKKADMVSQLHPLLHANISTIREQKFLTTFTGNEYFLADHIVDGKKILPGVAYVEMALNAAEIAGEMKVKKIKDIEWIESMEMPRNNNESCNTDVNIQLYPTEHKMIHYEVSTIAENNSKVIHSEGTVEYVEDDENKQDEWMDIEKVKERCSHKSSKNDCYKQLRNKGFDYGDGFQIIQQLCHNKEESLSYLVLPDVFISELDKFILHPSLMDGALQTVMGLDHENKEGKIYLPFAIGEIEIMYPLTHRCYAYVNRTTSTEKISKFNIWIMDDTGKILVKIKDFSMIEQQREGNDKIHLITHYNKSLVDLLSKIKNREISIAEGDEFLEGLYE
jgi:acyl transferase domain-containing protein